MDINVIVQNEFVRESDAETLFGDDNVIAFVTPETTLTELVTSFQLYPSKSQARKAGRVGELPKGWNVFKGNKTTFVYLWNPTE